MSNKQWSMTSLFEQFIYDSEKSRRLKKDGRKIRPQTVDNYRYVLLLLQAFEARNTTQIRVKEVSGKNKQQWIAESKYWKKFYLKFTEFLYVEKKCFDNYVGNVIKIIRVFLTTCRQTNYCKPVIFTRNFMCARKKFRYIPYYLSN